MTLPAAYLDVVQSGIPLSSINPGSTEFALPLDAVIRALEALEGTGIAVLGGDVLKKSDCELSYTYENWYSSKRDGEQKEMFARRSLLETKSYVEKFAVTARFSPLFVLVLDRD